MRDYSVELGGLIAIFMILYFILGLIILFVVVPYYLLTGGSCL